jgi:hypothetical protein
MRIFWLIVLVVILIVVIQEGRAQSVQVDSYVVWRDVSGSSLTAVEVEHKGRTCYVLLVPEGRQFDGSVSCVERR